MGKNAAEKESRRARAEEAARQQRIREGTTSINSTFGNQFNDQFFTDRATAYSDFARPQLDDQMRKAREQLTFALARNGTLDSSVRSQQFGELQKEYDTNLQDVAGKAQSYATDARTNVEKARQNLITTLQATGDAQGATQGALAQASILSQPQAYSPLSQLFTDFTAGLAQQAAIERAEAYTGGAIKARYNTGLFAPKSNAVKVS